MTSACWSSHWAANSSYWTAERIRARSFRGCAFLKTTSRSIHIRRSWEPGCTRVAGPAWFVWTLRWIDQDFVKTIIGISIVALCCGGCSTTRPSRDNVKLLPALRPYVREVGSELGMVSAERRAVLNEIASNVVAQLDAGKEANLTFICTHNSRRSHMSRFGRKRPHTTMVSRIFILSRVEQKPLPAIAGPWLLFHPRKYEY